jgi:hypothetical protein
MLPQGDRWIASRSLSSGAHSRDPLARDDEKTHKKGDLSAAIPTLVRRALLAGMPPAVLAAEQGTGNANEISMPTRDLDYRCDDITSRG